MATKQVPSVGRVVHFFMPDGDLPAPAIVTGALVPPMPESAVDLAIVWTDGISFLTNVPHRRYAAGHSYWDWPAHVPAVEIVE